LKKKKKIRTKPEGGKKEVFEIPTGLIEQKDKQ
jgi:hypothetical protein